MAAAREQAAEADGGRRHAPRGQAARFKLDVDDNAIETAVVEQILADESLASLIDELYWEQVVSASPMKHFGWGLMTRGPNVSNLAGSYEYFSRLRAVGVRAHSWV